MTTDRTHLTTERTHAAAEHLRRVGLHAEATDHAWLANLCWRKRVEALNSLGVSVARAARQQHRHPRIF